MHSKLSYEETPQYKKLINLFPKELKDNSMSDESDDGTGLDWIRRGGGLRGQKRKHDPEAGNGLNHAKCLKG